MCSAVKTAEDNVRKDRKTNLLVLVREYLVEEGYVDTLKALENESRLAKDYVLCDNVDLSTVLEEFESYYFVRFKKYPKISKKIKVEANGAKVKEKRRSVVKQKSEPVVNSGGKSVESEFLTVASCGGDESSYCEELPVAKLWKGLGSFEGFSDEWKTLADVIGREVINRNLNVKWDDVVGLEDAKQHLREAVVYPVKFPELFEGLLSPWKGLLLYGPSGTGKTLLAKAVATECQTTFFNISASSLVSKWRGDSEKLVRVMFELARHQAPSTIFIDELDALASKRDRPTEHEASRRLKSEFLVQLDGLANSAENIFFLTTSNLPWDLDPAVLRRLEKKILVDVPDEPARESLFGSFLPPSVNKHLRADVDYQRLAKASSGYSGAEIKLVCKEALMAAARTVIPLLDNRDRSRRRMKTPEPALVTTQDVLDVVARVAPSCDSKRFRSWLKETL